MSIHARGQVTLVIPFITLMLADRLGRPERIIATIANLVC